MMTWYDYLMCFFGGAFIANFVPHYVSGISGRRFPTPFNALAGQPAPPIGLSPPSLNVAWGMVNIAAGYALLRYGQFSITSWPSVIVAGVGFALMGFMLANAFKALPK